jgi:CheY-like chemotaxis protein
MKSILNTLNLIDGRISFTPAADSGEIVSVMLPVAPPLENMDDLSQLESSIRQRSLNVLIVEDNKLNSAILGVYLDGVSAVSKALSGNEALNIIDDFYGRGIVFNAVIMDIGLPAPWDGITLKSEIESRWPEYQNIPFLAQTAFTAKSYTDRISEHKFTHLLLKPINRIDLLRFIHQNTQ